MFPSLIGKIFLIISETANWSLGAVRTVQRTFLQLHLITRGIINLMWLQVVTLAKQDHFPEYIYVSLKSILLCL